jgi:NADPH-dependent glutamate synthase beta subunit-like oxidoreductase/NAD(P)H-flavin reductase
MIEKEVAQQSQIDKNLLPLFLFKRDFVQRRALKKYDLSTSHAFDIATLKNQASSLLGLKDGAPDLEDAVCAHVMPLMAAEKATPGQNTDKLEVFEKLVCALHHAGNPNHWASLKIPEKVEHEKLVKTERPDSALPEKIQGPLATYRRRDGFELTDKRMNRKFVMGEVDYCIYCHSREKDSCSKGLDDKKTGTPVKNPLGIALEGCPLEEKISEAHVLRRNGDSIAALAMIIVDNPMCPGTGHRICNDCMKSCIFQKQDPVNIPEIETNILTQVLELPFGFEIYSLLTRFNPLNRKRPYALPYNGKNILVVGMGPAGYTLAHYLLNEGFGVVGIDGLKIEPLPADLKNCEPIKDIKPILENLDQRTLNGFGGVAEYGITVRWDKNFLKIIYATLARREKFRVFGGVRFGGTISIDDAWSLGFDHIAMATGAGKPTVVSIKNNLIRGVRKASDFLMALQLTGAFKKFSLANLQIRLPAVVVGGGLTAIDTATEIMAYYPVQVEKILERHEVLVKKFGEEKVLSRATAEDKETLTEFLKHGQEVRKERERAKKIGEKPNFIPLIRSWGGVNLAYRKRMIDSPAYRLNHEEVTKALEEGIYFIENLNPVEALRDSYGALNGLIFERSDGSKTTLPARSLCVAAGTSPNIIYEREKPGTFELDKSGKFFQKYDDVETQLSLASKKHDAFFTSYQKDKRRISFYGDNHPDFAGNVVKAMASAKTGYPKVTALFADNIKNLKDSEQKDREEKFTALTQKLDDKLLARVETVVRLTPTIVEVIIKAPLAARNFHPGQFYRLQNYEAHAKKIEDFPLTMEGVALTGAWTDKDKGLLSLIVLEMGTSSRLCASLKKGEPVVIMGPTGTPTEIPSGKTVLLAGGGLGNAVLFSIGEALEANGNRVLYFAGYKHSADVFKEDEIEKSTDVIVWTNDSGPPLKPRRVQDKSFVGNMVQAMLAYAEGKLGNTPIKLSEVDHIIAIGSDRMMNAVRESRHGVLAPHLKKDHVAIGSINSSMQCMMKEVCAQCLQKHVDPKTGKEVAPVFSCFNQDQHLDCVDFQNLHERLQMNHLQEMLSSLWLDYLFTKQDVARV